MLTIKQINTLIWAAVSQTQRDGRPLPNAIYAGRQEHLLIRANTNPGDGPDGKYHGLRLFLVNEDSHFNVGVYNP